jgi:hypothetical protein
MFAKWSMNNQYTCIYKLIYYYSTVLTDNVCKPKAFVFKKFFPYKLESGSMSQNKYEWGFTVHIYILIVTLLHIHTIAYIFQTAPEIGKLPTRNPLILTFTCKSGWQSKAWRNLTMSAWHPKSVHSKDARISQSLTFPNLTAEFSNYWNVHKNRPKGHQNDDSNRIKHLPILHNFLPLCEYQL